MQNAERRTDPVGTDRFTLTFTCPNCEQIHEEFYLDNNESKTQLLSVLESLIIADCDDMAVIRHRTDGTSHDETFAILLAIAIAELARIRDE